MKGQCEEWKWKKKRWTNNVEEIVRSYANSKGEDEERGITQTNKRNKKQIIIPVWLHSFSLDTDHMGYDESL